MRLEILVGDREYLCPRRLPGEELDRLVQWITPGAFLARAGWAVNGDGQGNDPYGTAFLHEDALEVEHRTRLFLEYVHDVSAADQVTCVVLPFESALDADPTRLYDERTRHFVEVATREIGFEAVGCVRIVLSESARQVLRTLRDRGAAGSEPRSGEALAPVRTVVLDNGATGPEALTTMWSNYTRAILTLSEPLVSRDTIFGGRDRPSIIVDYLERNHLLVRPDVPADRVLAELSPGGGLFSLFARPLPDGTSGDRVQPS